MGDYNTNENIMDTGSSAVMNLEYLTAQYDTYLIIYEGLLTNYQNLLNNYPSGNFPYSYFPSQQYLGTSVGSPTVVSDASACETGCASTANCTGATYNSTNNTCSFVSGYGNIIPDVSSNFTSIIQANIAALINMQFINNQLIDINTQIENITQTDQTIYTNSSNSIYQNTNTLKQNNRILNQQKRLIQNKIKEYDELKREQIQGNINTTQNYMYYLLLLFIVILLIIAIFIFSGSSPSSSNTTVNNTNSQQQGGKLSISAYFILFIIILITIFIKYYPRIISFIRSSIPLKSI